MQIFLPWRGHFSELIRDILPWVWAHHQPGDILGGNPVHHRLYPGGLSPELWGPVASAHPQGYDAHVESAGLDAALYTVAQRCWPNTSCRAPWLEVLYHNPKPAIPLPDPVNVDVVLAPRQKHYAKNRWPWEELAMVCRSKGWRLGVAGAESESESLPVEETSWHLDPPGDAVTGTLKLLRGARCVVTLDSGIGHLASMVDAPQLVIYNRPEEQHGWIQAQDGRTVHARFKDMLAWNQNLCRPILGTVPAIIAGIEEVLAGRGAQLPVALKDTPNVVPLMAPPEVASTRLTVCKGCTEWTADQRCRVAGCACTGAGFASRSSSRCPLQKWLT
jgi:hypothetical protein